MQTDVLFHALDMQRPIRYFTPQKDFPTVFGSFLVYLGRSVRHKCLRHKRVQYLYRSTRSIALWTLGKGKFMTTENDDYGVDQRLAGGEIGIGIATLLPSTSHWSTGSLIRNMVASSEWATAAQGGTAVETARYNTFRFFR